MSTSLSTKYKRVRYGKELLAVNGTILKALVNGLEWSVVDVIENNTVLASGVETNVFRRNKAVKNALVNLGVTFDVEIRVSRTEKVLESLDDLEMAYSESL